MSFRDVLGKFIVLEKKPESPVESSSPLRLPAVAPSALPPSAPSPSAPAAPQIEGFDLSDLYQQEGVLPATLTAEHALKILSSLPEGLSPEIQRQAFNDLLQKESTKLGVRPEAVLEDARHKIDVLTASVKGIPGQVADFVAAAESAIAHHEEQIREKRQAIKEAQEQQSRLTQKCRSEIDQLTVVLQLLQS